MVFSRSTSFLPAAAQAAPIVVGATPDEVRRTERDVKAGDMLTLKLAAAGGAAVILEPAR
jgi:alpha-glucosidase